MDVSVFDLFPFGRSVGLLPMYRGSLGRRVPRSVGGAINHSLAIGYLPHLEANGLHPTRNLLGLVPRAPRRPYAPVCVDQARHHHPAAAIDHQRAVRWGRFAAGNLLDTIAIDKEAKPSTQIFGLSVEEQKIPEYDRRRGTRRSRLRTDRLEKPERCE
jgi:hypothetical protein